MHPLFFMHITKTAGGSLKELMRSSPLNIRFHYPGEPGWRGDFDYKDGADVYFGHYVYGVHSIVHAEARYAAFVRDPIARSISHFNHLKNNDRGPAGEQARAYTSIDAYILGARHWEFDNFLCRVISGVGEKEPFGRIGFDVYQQALEHLTNTFSFIGIFEDMYNSLERLNGIMQIIPDRLPQVNKNGCGVSRRQMIFSRKRISLPVINKGRYNFIVPPESLRLLSAVNRFDLLLYEDAVRLSSAGPGRR